ncbi:MAG: HAD-IA family hydrolase [Cyanobacteria bacterium P01_D01_bin.1]
MAVLIFDFDGTIADTLDTIVRITNRIAPEYGYSPTTPEKLRYYQSLSTKEMLKQSEIPLFRLPFLLRQVRREMGVELDSVSVASDLVPTLRDLDDSGHRLMIMSSNSKRNILRFLRRQGIADLFSSVEGGVGLLSKSRALKRIIRQEAFDFSQVIYVGDETRDIDASKQVGVLIAAVTWGFSAREALAAQSPAFLIDHPRQLLGAAQTLVNPSWVRKDYRMRSPTTPSPATPSPTTSKPGPRPGGRGASPSS